MSRRLSLLLTVAAASACALPATAAAAEAEGPAWSISPIATPTNFKPEDPSGDYSYEVTVINSGAKASDGSPVTITDTLAAGLEVKSVEMTLAYAADPAFGGQDFGTALGPNSLCEVDEGGPAAEVSCKLPSEFPSPPFAETADTPSVVEPGEAVGIVIRVAPGVLGEGQPLPSQITVEGGGADTETTTLTNEASSAPADRGFSYFHADVLDGEGKPVSQAASHPYSYTTSFALNTKPGPPGGSPFVPAGGDVKDVRISLPPGLAANPFAAERCTAEQFTSTHGHTFDNGKGVAIAGFVNECPDASAVGYVLLQQVEGERSGTVPLYNLVPPPGAPAQFGFMIATVPVYIDAEIRTGTDYGANGVIRNSSEVKRATAVTAVIWGTPADSRHDALRGSCLVPSEIPTQWSFGGCPAAIPDPKPLFRAPTSCGNPLETLMSFSTWTLPNDFLATSSTSPGLGGCDQVPFDPSLKARPTTDVADAPAGLEAEVHFPQEENEKPDTLAQADLRDTVVTLAPGLVLNPSGANGLGACSPAQIGLTSPAGVNPATFTRAAASCPDSARVGTVDVELPAVDHPLQGGVYVATPYENPFASLFSIYLAVADPVSGVVLKLAGKAEPDPLTGQITTRFERTPQQPFEDFRLHLYPGALAALRSPATCGDYASTSTMTPWSAPASGPPKTPSDPYAITKAPNGGPCATTPAQLPFGPSFNAGPLAPIAAASTPLAINLTREDGTAELATLSLRPPPGTIAKLLGTTYCSEAALAAAAARPGRAELANPSCPEASLIGSVVVAAGAGPAPYYTTGKAYLSPPYKGAPLSVAVITPAAAGPYDLGTVVSRAALFVDRESGRITADADPLPRILSGIPLDVRKVSILLDRPGFSLNPTNCDPMSFDGTATAVPGQSANLSNRFQLGECGRLGFAPKLSLRLKGSTRRGGHPSLQGTLTMAPGGANMARARIALPHSEFLDTTHIRTICTRVQFAAKACPPASIYGHVRATSPLVDYAVEGPVYLRSSSNPLPDLVATLRGPAYQPIEIDAVARVDSVHGGTRVTFATLPDIPVSKVVLTMQGGKKGLLLNSRNICKTTNRATVQFDGQNGKAADSRPKLKAKCPKGKKRGKKSKG